MDCFRQTGGCRQTGRSATRRGGVQDFLACWGVGARGWSSCCYGGQRGSGQLRLALMFGLLYSKIQFVWPAHMCASYCTKPNRTQACEQVPLLHVVVVLWPLPRSILQLAAAIMPRLGAPCADAVFHGLAHRCRVPDLLLELGPFILSSCSSDAREQNNVAEDHCHVAVRWHGVYCWVAGPAGGARWCPAGSETGTWTQFGICRAQCSKAEW